MADTKVSALTAATNALTADELPINEAGTSKKLTVMQVLAAGRYAPGSFTIPDGGYMIMADDLILTGSDTATIEGSGTLRILD